VRIERGQLRLADVTLRLDAPLEGEGVETAAGRGITAFRTYWWGWRAYLSDSATHELVTALVRGGQAAPVLLAGWFGPLGAAVIGVFLVIAYGVFSLVDAVGGHYGVTVSGLWTTPLTPPWPGAQSRNTR
jgi:hypothetical protein